MIQGSGLAPRRALPADAFIHLRGAVTTVAKITSDHDLRDALKGLNPDQQRRLGARFAQSVARLVTAERVHRAITTALRDDCTLEELDDAYRAAKAHAINSYTDCGKETDWLAQADHFAAAAAAAALTPETPITERHNRAWKAAVQARMAINCAMMESADEPGDVTEAQRQYAIANAFLDRD